MKKPAIFIDAFITSEEKKKWFDYNVTNFIKAGYDVFIISNKMISFDKFADVKYFEYDSTNRILLDKSKYKLYSKMRWSRVMFPAGGNPQEFSGISKMHGFTNWTILYNLKKIAKVLKRFGYDHAIRCEYDVVFKSYDLMDTIFKDFGKSENSKNIMIIPGSMGVTTNFFLFGVDYIDKLIGDLETEDDYMKLLNSTYGDNTSPVLEDLFWTMVDNSAHYLNKEDAYKHIEKIDMCVSDGDLGLRHPIMYKSLQVTPVNNNSELFICNTDKKRTIYLDFATDGRCELLKISPDSWLRVSNCKNFVEIHSSEFPDGRTIRFDLSLPNSFTIKPMS